MIKLKVYEGSTLTEELNLETDQELIVGRGSTSDITLENHPGVSREHALFKIIGNKVFVELISNNGVLVYNGTSIKEIELQHTGQVVSIPPYDFHFEIEEEEEDLADTGSPRSKANSKLDVDNNHDDEPLADVSRLVPVTDKDLEQDFEQEYLKQQDTSKEQGLKNYQDSENFQSPQQFQDEDVNDEKTSTGIKQHLDYSLKVFKENSFLQEIAIEGSKWTFGRGKESDYTINSKKASRNHFVLMRIGPSFYVRDLGSSNGTLLNNQQLPSNQEVELKSGDYIELAEFKFIFEIKDKDFEEKIKNISLVEESAGNKAEDIDDIRESALVLNDEVVKLGGIASANDNNNTDKDKKIKNIRIGILFVIILIGAVYYLQDPKKEDNSAELASLEEQKRQAQQLKNAAIDKFNLGLRFYNESQFERCILEIDEFLEMDIQTDETAGARELRNQCEIEKERLQRQKDLELQQAKLEEIKRRVQEIIDNCKPTVKEGVSALESCLSEALSLDPSNEQIAALVDEAQSLAIKREEEAKARQRYLNLVSKGKQLFNEAKEYNEYGDWKRALKTYDRFIKSSYPDPAKLKEKAKRNMASINTNINGQLEKALLESKEALQKAEYKKAVLAANKGLEVNRDHEELLETKNEASKLLKIILRRYYQESIIEEDFGQIAEAKIKWKKILEEGVIGSEYYKKAQLKLRYYEEGFQ